MNKTIFAIDGGATKTAMTVCDHEGFELFSATTTGSNYQAIGQKNVVEVLTHLLTDAANNLHDWHIDGAVFAIAGIDTAEDARIVSEIVAQSIAASPLKIEHYVVENDVEATLKGLTGNEPGALLISGTGAIAYGYNGDEIVRCGGWGHRAGDEGSGYWIGQQVARSIFKAFDGRAPQTSLTDYVLEACNLQSVDQLVNFLYNSSYTNARLASLGSQLQRACEDGDSVSLDIANKAATELALLAETILQRLGITTEPFTFYLNGGVLKHNDCIYKLFEGYLQAQHPSVSFILCNEQPLYYLRKRAQLLLQKENLS